MTILFIKDITHFFKIYPEAGPVFLAVLLLAYLLRNIKVETLNSNWNNLIDDFSFSTKEFYSLLSDKIKEKEIEGIQIESVFHSQSTLISAKREYLRIEWRNMHFDVCAAPFAKGYFISWWNVTKRAAFENIIAAFPLFGEKLRKLLYPETYYKADTASMFYSTIHQCVLDVIEDITRESGVRKLTEDEKKPILKDPFNR